MEDEDALLIQGLEDEWAQLDNDAIDATIRALMEVPSSGGKLLWWLLEITRIYQNAFVDDARRTAFNLGEQNIGHQLLARIMAVSPQQWFELEKEMNDERRARDRARDSVGTNE